MTSHFGGFLLHFYQPPFQKREIVDQICYEAYLPLVKMMQKHTQMKMTWNISGCLWQLWEKYGHIKLIHDIADLVKSGKVELTGSSAYHAFLPKLPSDIVRRQIKIQNDILHIYVGSNMTRKGFFPPELAYRGELEDILLSEEYEWVILDERAKKGTLANRAYMSINGLRFLFRDRDISYAFSSGRYTKSEKLYEDIGKKKSDYPTIIALDAETFGHHHKKYEKILSDVLSDVRFEWLTLSGLIERLSARPRSYIQVRPSSWTILDRNRSIRTPFLRWSDRGNKIHQLQWQLTRLTCDAKHDEKSLALCDKALFSCQYWWACAKPWWQVEMIEAGAHALLQSVIYSHATAAYKKQAAELYHRIISTAFDWMRTGKMQERVDREHEHLHYAVHKKPNI
jgi:hypothetical protein